jgi:formylglycine-generating enzyme required for sulfatase activity/pectate lyase
LIGDTFSAEQNLIRAFPEAEGFGAFTPGGRGGDIHFVTTLDDYVPGKERPIPGSLRAAVDAEGPRYILVRVSGTIELRADLWIRNPYVTIAGQTAPGGGICIKDYMVVLATHDIVIRYLRFRSGDETRKEQMSIGIFGGHDSIIDHCSMSWAIDEVMSSFGSVHNLTVQWSIIAEGLSRSFHPKGEHSKGSILNGDGGVSIHHCIYAHNSARNPRVDTIILDFRNNIIYNWGYRAGYTSSEPCIMNYVGNYLKPGPSTRSSATTDLFEPADAMARIYLHDNQLVGHSPETNNNRLLIDPPEWIEDDDGFRDEVVVDSPFLCPFVQTTSAEVALQHILASAGATLPERDIADQRLMKEIETGTGRIIDSPKDVGGWPVLVLSDPPLDSDRDGMPDTWELKHQFDRHSQVNALEDPDNDGYPNLEEFLNGTNPRGAEEGHWINAEKVLDIQQKAIQLSAKRKAEFREFQKRKAERLAAEQHEKLDRMNIEVIPRAGTSEEQYVVKIGDEAHIELVKIPAGSFLMGSPESEGGLPGERPQHRVIIARSFYMAKTMTTNAQVMPILGKTPRRARKNEIDFPAHEVNWHEAVKYCETLSAKTGRTFRLPTEAEWEYACRAGTTTAFNTGDTISTDQANFDGKVETPLNPAGKYIGKERPVATYPPNAWGLYDMHGNQAEYCLDVAYRKYTEDTVTDPVNLSKEGARVLRGGKAKSKAFYIRSAYRYAYHPKVGYGFRVVMEN